MKRFFSAIENFSGFLLLFSGILILIMGFLSTYAVGRRYIFQNPEPYSYEISTMFLVGSVMLAVAGLQRERKHLVVDFVLNYLPKKIQIILTEIISTLMGIIFILIVFWQSLDNALYSLKLWEKSQSSWGEPLFPTKFSVPFGMAFLLFVLFIQLARGIIKIREKKGI